MLKAKIKATLCTNSFAPSSMETFLGHNFAVIRSVWIARGPMYSFDSNQVHYMNPFKINWVLQHKSYSIQDFFHNLKEYYAYFMKTVKDMQYLLRM